MRTNIVIDEDLMAQAMKDSGAHPFALLGFDHEKLTFRSAGRDFRLTDVHGNVVRELIA